MRLLGSFTSTPKIPPMVFNATTVVDHALDQLPSPISPRVREQILSEFKLAARQAQSRSSHFMMALALSREISRICADLPSELGEQVGALISDEAGKIDDGD